MITTRCPFWPPFLLAEVVHAPNGTFRPPAASFRFLPTAPREKVPHQPTVAHFPVLPARTHKPTFIPLNPAVSFVASTPPPRTPQRNLTSWRCLAGPLSDTRSPCHRPALSHPCLIFRLGSRISTVLAFFGGQILRHIKFFCADLLLSLPPAPARTYPDSTLTASPEQPSRVPLPCLGRSARFQPSPVRIGQTHDCPTWPEADLQILAPQKATPTNFLVRSATLCTDLGLALHPPPT